MMSRRDGVKQKKAKAFQIEKQDNVATALTAIPAGQFVLLGNGAEVLQESTEEIPQGHKVAIRPIQKGETIIKYGVSIGEATADIAVGQWVHLHCMKSSYDKRSSKLDIHTGIPSDIPY